MPSVRDASLPSPSSRERRLRLRGDFLRVQQTGLRVTSAHFVFLLASGAEPRPSRLGITVSRKVGNAVVRNRAKRIVREAFRALPGFVPDGIDLVVVVRAPLEGMKAQDALQEWRSVSTLVERRSSVLVREPSGQGGADP